jgi:hypothetical protein
MIYYINKQSNYKPTLKVENLLILTSIKGNI